MTIVVPPRGNRPNLVLLVGERPGRQEAEQLSPFVGKSGAEQEAYLARHGVSAKDWRVTNVCLSYDEHNEDPSAADINEWTPKLLAEVKATSPRLVVAVGRYAMRWFLGQSAELDTCWGLPHHAGAFDPSRKHRAYGAVVVPIVHPAAGFYDGEQRAIIAAGYERVAAILKDIQAGKRVNFREDEWAGRERYEDVGGEELASRLVSGVEEIGLDTEGVPGNPWSVQVSIADGMGLVLRRSRQDFAEGAQALQRLVNKGVLVVAHNLLWDMELAREMELELRDAKLADTQYQSYLLRLEPQGLKPLAYRWCGMKMKSYSETVGDVGRDKQLDYLARVLEIDWPKPEPRVIIENDGRVRLYKPQPIAQRVEKILLDCYTGKVDKDGNLTDPHERWKQVDKELRLEVERRVGEMPVGTLDDIPLDQAIAYSARDADATLRLYHKLKPELKRLDLNDLMNTGMEVLPVFESMQSNGMPASRKYFQSLADEMTDEMERLQTKISTTYFHGRPFNPGSPVHVRTLMRRRGLEGAEETSTGEVSTGKRSIEHLRFTDPAIADVFEWREKQHVRDSFCAPVLERIPPDEDIYPVRCKLKTTRTATRRLASTDPNLLAIPSRKKLGKRVRDGYVCPPGEVFGAWDFSAMEMRVMAHESRDPLMVKLFKEGRDIHTETAMRIFGLPEDKIDRMEHRYPAKTAGFGIIYGIQGQGLLAQLRTQPGMSHWTEQSCDKLIREWMKIYKGVKDYIERVVKETERLGLVRSHWKMIRYLPGIWSDDKKIKAEAGRHAVSHKIQEMAQGMVQESIKWLKPRVRALQLREPSLQWRNEIHDELLLSFEERLWEEVNELLMEGLTKHCGVELIVPVEAEGHMSRCWGGLK